VPIMSMSDNNKSERSYWSIYRSAHRRTAHDLAELDNAVAEQALAVAVNETFEADCVYELQNDPSGLADNSIDACNDTEFVCDSCNVGAESYSDLHELQNPVYLDPTVFLDSDDEDSDSHEADNDGFGNAAESVNEQLAQWSLESGIPQTAVSKLLHILKPICPSLPLDARTLWQTPRQIEKKSFGTGDYVHLGLEDGISRRLSHVECNADDEIQLQFNIDGLPLFKSSNIQLWPILCLITQPRCTDPFVVGLFCGTAKPPVCFLNEFVSELQQLMENGMSLGTGMIHVHIKLHSFVCDAPARSFVKCTKLHSGYSSCDRCDQHGEWCGKVVFSCVPGSPRTDESFRNQTDSEHHTLYQLSPLTALNVDMIRQFPLDPMHLLHLGVTRKLLLLWIHGPLSVRWSSRVTSSVSSFLLSLCPHIPREFCRRPRSLAEIDRWKATEFRLFLLYCGPVVLKPFLADSLYRHFMILFAACTILSHKQLSSQFHQYAGSLLTSFVHGFSELYGKSHLVYNVHCLLHLADDVARYGCLANFSAYPFENKLKEIKRLVRKPNLPLQQIAFRLAERNRYASDHICLERNSERNIFHREHTAGPVPHSAVFKKQFHRLSLRDMQLSVSLCDSCVQLTDKSVVVIRNILELSDGAQIVYNKFNIVADYFDYPLSSSSLGIFRVSSL